MIGNIVGLLGIELNDTQLDSFVLPFSFIIFGIIGIYAGIANKHFYATLGRTGYVTKREIDSRFVRLLFIIVGLGFILGALYIVFSLLNV